MLICSHCSPNQEVDVNIDAIARVTHEANRAVQVETGDPAVSPHWDDAPQWQRDSAIEGVQQAVAGATPRELHESWCRFKADDGWVYGEIKDSDAKTHPCLVDYEQLPLEQRVKDDLFRQIVISLAPLVD
jgi:hypothetical protein